MYSFRQVLKQEPAAIVAVISHVFAVLVVLNVVHWSADAIAILTSTALSVLTLFYVRPFTSSKDALRELTGQPPQPTPTWEPATKTTTTDPNY